MMAESRSCLKGQQYVILSEGTSTFNLPRGFPPPVICPQHPVLSFSLLTRWSLDSPVASLPASP